MPVHFGDRTTNNGTLTVTHSHDKQAVYFARLLGTDSLGRTNHTLSESPVIIVRTPHDQDEHAKNSDTSDRIAHFRP